MVCSSYFCGFHNLCRGILYFVSSCVFEATLHRHLGESPETPRQSPPSLVYRLMLGKTGYNSKNFMCCALRKEDISYDVVYFFYSCLAPAKRRCVQQNKNGEV